MKTKPSRGRRRTQAPLPAAAGAAFVPGAPQASLEEEDAPAQWGDNASTFRVPAFR